VVSNAGRTDITNKFKLLVIDVDGTLVNKDGDISADDRRALAETVEAGIQVSLCTGRVTRTCLSILDKLCLDGGYHIFFDGALVYDCKKDKELFSRPLAAEMVREACEAALANGVPLDLFSSTRYFVIEESWRSQIRRDYFGIEPVIADFKTIWQKEKIIKGGIVVSSVDEKQKASRYLAGFTDRLSFPWTVTPAYPDCHFINIVDKGVSKGKALQALSAHLGIEKEEVLAIGDGSNDVSLLSAAGLAVSMQNSPTELKAVADFITADVDHSGVARAVRKFLL
jgi:5-amino-6-(5-phospho-D-ribitylamino)uracil phosphatase